MTTTYIKTLRYRIKDSRHRSWLGAKARAVNVVWNYCNAAQAHALKHCLYWPSERELKDATKGSSKLIGLHSKVIQDLCDEYVKSRRGSGKRLLRWRTDRSLGWIPISNQTIKINGSTVTFDGRMFDLWLHRPIEGKIKSASFNSDARRRWYCNLNVELPIRAEVGREDVAVGIDVGLKQTLALSDGNVFNTSGTAKKYATKLAKARRARKPTLRKTLYAKISNTQRDLAHKVTCHISRTYNTLFVGSLSAKQLGALFPKQTSDSKIGLIKVLLRYKAIARGGRYVEVPEFMTSRTCSSCGHVPEEWPNGIAGCEIREWTCNVCNSNHDRDINAARNILRLGHQALAEGTLDPVKRDATVQDHIA